MKSVMTQKNNNTSQISDILNQLSKHIEESKELLVVAHIDPDGDSLGCLLAMTTFLKDMGKKVFPVITDEIPQKYMFLKGVEDIPAAYDYEKMNIDTAILLECPSLSRINGPAKYISDKCTIINIDHHLDNQISGNFNWVDSGRSSVGEMLYEFFEYVQYEISQDTAEQLYTAILTDTGRFRFSSTSPRTMEIVSKLVAAGADTKKICDKVYYEMPIEALLLTGKVLNTLEYHFDNKLCLITLDLSMIGKTNSKRSAAEGLVDFTMFGKGVEIGVFLKEVNTNTTKVSFRSNDKFDVAEIASRFDGGGHKNAAGCTLPMSLKSAKETVLKLFGEMFE